MARAEFKVPGGKLLVAETEVKDEKMVWVKLTGDFFMHPEYAIEELEETLKGIQVSEIDETVETFFQCQTVEIIGADPEDFSHVIKLSLGASRP